MKLSPAVNVIVAHQSQLFEVEPTDPATFAAASGLLAVISLLACLLPARRAAALDPAAALRSE